MDEGALLPNASLGLSPGRASVWLFSSSQVRLDHRQVASFLLNFLERSDQSLRPGWG